MAPFGASRAGLMSVAEDDIPDSVVYQYDARTYDGSDTWTDDVGNQNMTIVGSPTKSTLSDGSDSISGDGVDDAGRGPKVPNIIGDGEFTIEFAFQADINEGDFLRWGTQTGAGDRFSFREHAGDTGGDSGSMEFQMADSDGNRFFIDPQDNVSLFDGTRHDITWIIKDLNNNDAEIIIDGQDPGVNVGFGESPHPNNFPNEDMGFWGVWDGSSFTEFWDDLEFGAIRIHDEAILEQTISGYPW